MDVTYEVKDEYCVGKWKGFQMEFHQVLKFLSKMQLSSPGDHISA